MADELTADQVEARMTELRDGVLSQGPADDGFDAAAVEYSGLLVKAKAARVQANEAAITNARGQLGMGIQTLVDSLGLAELKQEPITRVTWTFVPASKGEDDAEIPERVEVTINSSTASRARTPREPGDGTKSDGRDLQLIFDASANDEEHEKMAALVARHELAEDAEGSLRNSKKFNSATWALKNAVANRVEKESAATA